MNAIFKKSLWAALFALVFVNLLSCSADDESAPANVNTRAALPVTVSGVINANTTWTSNNVYQLSGKVYVSGGATLTIEAGTWIEGLPSETPEDASALVITRGSKICAVGTESEPIVFTAANGQKGGWGGLVLLGKAPNNQGPDVLIEGIDPTTAPAGVDVYYGGDECGDCSGVLSYVRVEFAGAAIATDNELNSFTFGSVGCGTKINHLQAYYGADDGFEWFGGCVNGKYLISTAADDDAFDFDFGYRGKLQFLLAVLDPGASYSANANGLECDNNATGASVAPYTRPIISNLTVVGTSTGSAAGGTVLYGAHFRRAAHFVLRNSILYGYKGSGANNVVIYLQGSDVSDNLGTDLSNICSDSSYLANNVIGLIGGAVPYSPASAVTVNSSAPAAATGITLIGPFNYWDFFNANVKALAPNGNPALHNADFTGLIDPPCFICPFVFTETTYKGAVSNDNYWIADCWVNKNFPLFY